MCLRERKRVKESERERERGGKKEIDNVGEIYRDTEREYEIDR